MAAARRKQPDIDMKARWTPGHEGIPGNERADEEATRAAEGKSGGKQELPNICRQALPVSQSAVHQSHRKKVHAKVKKLF